MNDQNCRRVVISNPNGFHARPAFLFAELASKFECAIELLKKDSPPAVDGTSILEIITLGAVQGTELMIKADGPDADAALEALSKLVNDGFRDHEVTEQS